MSSGDMEASGPPTSRKQKSLGFGNWLRKGNSRATDDSSKKLESPAEEIKQVFLRQLELSSIELDGTYYHSVFTGAQIVDIIYRHFGLPDRTLASKVASRLIDCSLYTHVSGESQGVVDSNSEMYTLTEEAHMALKALRKSDSTDTDVDVDADERQQQRGKTQAWGVLKAGWAVPGRLDVAAARRMAACAVHVAAGQGALEAAVAGSARVAAAVAAGEAAARRLPVQSFVGRAAARLARYPLLLDAIARRGVGDAAAVLRAAAKVRAALREVDARTGAEAAGHRLRLISARLVLAPAARASLRLDSAARRLEMEGELRDAAGARVRVFLFDNALVVARERRVAHARSVPVYDAADAIVPVALLAAHAPRAAGLARRLPARRDAPAVVFAHIARGWRHALVAACARDRDRWLAAVARAAARPHTRVAALACVRVVTDVAPRAPVCAAAEGALALVGARDGLHAAVAAGGAAPRFVRVAAPGAVARVLVLAAQRVAVVLADGALHAYALDAIEAAAAHGAPLPPAQAASSVALVAAAPAHALVVLAKTRGARSVVKCLHASRDAPFLAPPAAHFSVPGRARHVLFLRRKLCVAAGARFHVADVASARVLRVLPDPQDDDFAFLDAEGPALVALASCKVGREFLLCYDAVAFFIDNFGRRARPHVLVRWEAPPTCLTFRPPYVVAFNPAFIEVRHIHDGALLSIIRLPSAVCLDPDSTATTLRVAIGPGPVGFPAPQPCGPDDSAATFQPPRPVSTAESSASASSSTSTSTSTSTSSSSPSSSSSPASSSPSSAASAIPTPVTTAADPPPVQGYVVPGLAGPDGDRLFPASHSPNHYRIIEIHLPSTLEPSKPPQ
ncbi:RHO1 GDP-GTP exchange protein 2 [Coemansia sp. RSA 2320]|nr:RHO1 GDP-GTP exchange protein 2 [Coemansia sp. RSA 2320]